MGCRWPVAGRGWLLADAVVDVVTIERVAIEIVGTDVLVILVAEVEDEVKEDHVLDAITVKADQEIQAHHGQGGLHLK